MQRASSPYRDRAPSPYRVPSPYGTPSAYALPFVPPTENQFPPQANLPTSNVQVGSTTYTTSTGPDGRTVYHHLKAVAASYQTPNGVVSGIQWVPTEAPVPSVGQSDFSGGYGHKDERNSMQDWQRTEEKKRKQEEKESKRNLNDPEYELNLARERDAQSSVNRERRKSFNAGGTGPIPGSNSFTSTTGNTGYPVHPNAASGYPSPYSSYSNLATAGTPVPPDPYGSGNIGHSRKQSGAYADITRQFNDLDIDGNKERPRTASGNYVDRANPYPAFAYAPASGPYSNPKNVPAGPGIANSYPNYSPNMHPSDISHGSTNLGYQGYPSRDQADPIGRSTTPFGAPPPQVYPRGHVLEGQPIVNNNNSRSRAPSPNPVSMLQGHASVNMSGNSLLTEPHHDQLPAPEAFSRPINAANSYAPFDNMKVVDMDDLYDAKVPKMPIVLTTHDIFQDDWKRCIQDLARSWTGQLPVGGLGRDGRPPKPSALSADLINLWNISFFGPRGVELVLYKGRERRTGPHAGQLDPELTYDDDSDDLSSSSSSLEYRNPAGGHYGRPPVEMSETRRRRHEEKQERRRRRKEKKARRKAKAKGYSVYVTYLPLGNPNSYGKGMAGPGGYNNPVMQNKPHAGYGGMNVPQSRSQGYGTGY